MIALGRYAEANAVAHAILPDLLTREEYAALARGPTVQESWNALRRTAYGAWLQDDTAPDALTIERRLREVTAVWQHRAIRRLHGPALGVGELLLARWELDHLQFILRLWHGRDAHFESLLGFPLFLNNIAAVALASADSLEGIAQVLRTTPYGAPLRDSAPRYRQTGAIVYPELALERDYYGRLLAATSALGGADARRGIRLVSDEIDALNLSWLNRLQAYHQIPAEQAGELLIPGPSPLSRQFGIPGADYARITGAASDVLGQYGEAGAFRGPPAERAALLERALAEMVIARARADLSGYPFTIAGVFAFHRLLRTELANLCCVFAGRRIGVPDHDLMSRIRGVK
ncbi:MAG: V-type ATPase subunit [Candidatus Hydrogenedentes bacterium]|nr:V-type ATPase subunit [Candidatus Hydrogenedentota bacterium]